MFTSDSSGELHIFRHDGDSFSMNRTKIGIFEKSNKVSFGSFLQSKNCYLFVPKKGLEPSRLSAHAPETCASTNSATWAWDYR